MRRRLLNVLRRARHGLEHQRPASWVSFERAMDARTGPGHPLVEAALRVTRARRSERGAMVQLERVEARRRALLDSEAHVTFRVDGDAASAGTPQVVGPLTERACKPPPWALLLHNLAAARDARSALELGTCFGISAAYIAAGLGPGGRVVSLEGCADYAEIARETLRRVDAAAVELVFGRFDRTLPGALEGAAPIDLLFVDGHHDEAATVAYFEAARPHLAPGAVVVFDDIRWSPGMTRAWEQLRRGGWVDLGSVGLCVLEGAPTG